MKKILLIITAILILGGCTLHEPFDIQKHNDANIIEYKKCTEAGMGTVRNGNGDILCAIPKNN